MRFYGKPNQIVWDASRDKKLCAFDKNGEYTTEDEYELMLLKLLGYMGDFDAEDFNTNTPEAGTVPELPKGFKFKAKAEGKGVAIHFDKMTKPELIDYCKENDIKGYSKFNLKDLRTFVYENRKR